MTLVADSLSHNLWKIAKQIIAKAKDNLGVANRLKLFLQLAFVYFEFSFLTQYN